MFKFGQKYNRKLDDLIGNLPGSGKVLDLGCGMGGNSIFLTEKGFNVDCVDADKEAIDNIKQNYPNINAICDNILNFKFTENNYDLILALNVLNFFKKEDIEIILEKIKKSLKKNGLIYIQVFSINNPCKKFDHLFSKDELLNYFSENKVLECEEIIVKDNHPPQGEHGHNIIKILVRKE